MSVKSVLTIWLVAAALFVATWLAPRTGPDGPDRITSVHATPIPVDDVDRVRIRRMVPGVDAPVDFEFVRGPQGWRQVAPFDIRADGFAVRQLVVAAADLQATRRWLPGDELDPERVGFDDQCDRVELAWPDARVEILLGDRTVAGRGWIRVEDDGPVFVVGGGLHERALDDDLRNWRSRRLLPSDEEFAEISVRNGPLAIDLRREGRVWEMRAPIESRVDDDALQRFLGVLGRIEHDGFVVDDPKDLDRFGLGDPPVAVEVSRIDGTRERILIGGPSGLVGRERFAMMDGVPSILRLDEASIAGLLPAVEDLLATTGTGVRRGDVRQLTIASPGGQIRLDRKLDRWRIEVVEEGRTQTGAADPRLVERLLDLLTESRANEVRVQDYPGALEIATVVLHGFDGVPMDTVRIARERNAGRWAFENGDGVLRLHPSATKIPLRPDDWTVYESSDP